MTLTHYRIVKALSIGFPYTYIGYMIKIVKVVNKDYVWFLIPFPYQNYICPHCKWEYTNIIGICINPWATKIYYREFNVDLLRFNYRTMPDCCKYNLSVSTLQNTTHD